MKFELDDITYEKVKKLSKSGDECQRKQEFAKAIGFYNEALILIPDPKVSWDASTWLFTALGETYFLMKKYPEMKKALLLALSCPNGADNPFIHLRLGQAYYETGNRLAAKKEFVLANNLDFQKKVFTGEDKKYMALLNEG